MSYLPRIADDLLVQALKAASAVQIKGPKWCGKTETAKKHSNSAIYLQDPDERNNYLALADAKPSLLLEGKEPRLIDEWEMAPVLWDAVRFAVDKDNSKGRFILTGSSVPKVQPAHSGVGRIARFEMTTMSLWESNDSNGAVSLKCLFEGQHDIGAIATSDIEDYAYYICRGGWPVAVTEDDRQIALIQAKNYISELLDTNLGEMDDKQRNPSIMRAIMRSYARNIATRASISTIKADIVGESPSDVTITDYIDALRRAYVISEVPAWNPKLRSKTAVRTSPTRHYIDPSLAAALLGATPSKLLYDFETFGLLFEELCIHDLKCYAQPIGGSVYHYRDKNDLEVDAIVALEDGSWGAVEVKLGAKDIDKASANLLKLARTVDTEVVPTPSFCMVLTATGSAYTRKDGVLVVPLATLKP